MRSRLAINAVAVVSLLLGSLLHAQLVDSRSRLEALQFFRNGQEFMAGEQFDRAAEEFLKAIAKDPLMIVAHYQLGQAYMGLQRYASAQRAYKDCLQAARALYDLQGENRFAVEKERIDMIREMQDTVRRMKANGEPLKATQLEAQVDDLKRQETPIEAAYQPPAEALLALGSAFFRNGQRDEAELEWKAAIDANPKLGQAHNNLAVVYMQAGRLDEADQEIKLAEKNGFRVNPQFKEDLKKRKAER